VFKVACSPRPTSAQALAPSVAFDAIGGSYIDTLAQTVAPEGTIYLYGLLSEEANNYPTSAFFKSLGFVPMHSDSQPFVRVAGWFV
jgi:NADPH:quinone reductase-like Zn-dependent oxidoreductase